MTTPRDISRLESSLKGAERRLSAFRKEQGAAVAETQRLSAAMSDLVKSTEAYAASARKLSGGGKQVSDLNRQGTRGIPIMGRLGGAIGKVSQQLGKAGKVGLVLGAALGVAATGIAIFNRLKKSLDGYVQKAVELQNLSARGFSPESYQRVSAALQTITHDAGRANSILQSIQRTGEQLQTALAYDPGRISRQQLRALSELGIGIKELTGEVGQDFGRLAEATKELIDRRGLAYAKGALADLVPDAEAVTAILRAAKLEGEELAAAGRAFNAGLALDAARIKELEKYADAQNEVNHLIAQTKGEIVTALAPAFTELYNQVLPLVQSIAEWTKESENVNKITRVLSGAIQYLSLVARNVGVGFNNLVGIGRIVFGTLQIMAAETVHRFGLMVEGILRGITLMIKAFNRLPGPDIPLGGLEKATEEVKKFNQGARDTIEEGVRNVVEGGKQYARGVKQYWTENIPEAVGFFSGNRGGQSLPAFGTNPHEQTRSITIQDTYVIHGNTDPNEIAEQVGVIRDQSVSRAVWGNA